MSSIYLVGFSHNAAAARLSSGTYEAFGAFALRSEQLREVALELCDKDEEGKPLPVGDFVGCGAPVAFGGLSGPLGQLWLRDWTTVRMAKPGTVPTILRDYAVFAVDEVVDGAIDLDASRIDRATSPWGRVERLVFRPERVPRGLFRIAEQFVYVFATEAAVRDFRSRKLSGLQFAEVWPTYRAGEALYDNF